MRPSQPPTDDNDIRFGVRENLGQFLLQLVQVLCIGLTLGTLRTVVPALAESEFGLAKGSFLLLVSFVVAFGLVKAVLNFVAGRLSERIGRRAVLALAWVAALPVPLIVWFAPGWGWIVVATMFLGINQGLGWSMAQTSKLDLARADQRGVAIGLNEFAGYVGVALAGIVTAYLVPLMGARGGLAASGLGIALFGLCLTLAAVRDTLRWARAETRGAKAARVEGFHPCYPKNVPSHPTTAEVFAVMSWGDARLAAVCQAGLVEKFVDALIWVVVPAWLYQKGLTLAQIGWIVGTYGFVWGCAQLLTGRLSDRIGRHLPNVAGMWVCGAGVALMPLSTGLAWWNLSAVVMGLGMALLYPNLSAAVADLAPPAWRGSAIGIYRFWRDLGYAVGALGLGFAASLAGALDAAFWFVALSMFASGAVLALWGGETHPRINPCRDDLVGPQS